MSCGVARLLQPSGLIEEASLHTSRLSSSQQFDVRWANGESKIREILSHIQPNRHSELQRRAIAGYVAGLVQKCLDCEVFMFGSVPLKTYLPDGDIDLTAFSRHRDLKDSWAVDVQTVLEYEAQRRDAKFKVRNVQCIHAEVKIVKCLVDNVVVDISFNQLGGLCTLCFLEEVDRLIQRDHLFKQSIILIKAWCYYESRILGAHHALLSTYALETLVLYVFHVFHPMLRGPLEVLFTFLDYFSKFNWEKYCLSVWGPVSLSTLPDLTVEPPFKERSERLLSKEFLKACSALYDVCPKGGDMQERAFIGKHLNIVDTLRVSNNLGRSVSQANFYRIRSAFRRGARELTKLFEVADEEFSNCLDNIFSNTIERQRYEYCPDAPSWMFPPYEFIYKGECLEMVHDAGAKNCFRSQNTITENDSGILMKDIKMKTSDETSGEDIDLQCLKGFPHSNKIRTHQCHVSTTHLTCPVDHGMLRKNAHTQVTPPHNMTVPGNKDQQTGSFWEQSTLEREHTTRLNAKVMKNDPSLQDLEENGHSYESYAGEGVQDAGMSLTETASEYPLSKAASDISTLMQGGSIVDIGFRRAKSWPASNTRKNNKRSGPSCATSNNTRISSAFEGLIASNRAMQKPLDFLFPGSPDLPKALSISSSSPTPLQSSSSSALATSFLAHQFRLSQDRESAKDLACTFSTQGSPCNRFIRPSEDVQSLKNCIPEFHGLMLPQTPINHQLKEMQPKHFECLQKAQQDWLQPIVEWGNGGLQIQSPNKVPSALGEANKSNQGSYKVMEGVSVARQVAIPTEASNSERLSRANMTDKKMQSSVEKYFNAHHRHLSSVRVNTQNDIEVTSLPVSASGMNPDSCLCPALPNLSDNKALASSESMSVYEPSGSFSSPSGPPMLSYYNPSYPLFPLNYFSPFIQYEHRGFLLEGAPREYYLHNYHNSGQIPESTAAALSARFASLSAEENGIDPHRDLLRGDLAHHLRNLEFARYCQDPDPQALSEQSSVFYGSQDPSLWGDSSHMPLHSSLNQVISNSNGLVLFASQNAGGLLHGVSSSRTQDAIHLRKQGAGTGTVLPARNTIHKQAWQHEPGPMERHFSLTNYASAAPNVYSPAACHGSVLPFAAGKLQFGSLRPVDITNLQGSDMSTKQSDRSRSGGAGHRGFPNSSKANNNNRVILNDKKRE